MLVNILQILVCILAALGAVYIVRAVIEHMLSSNHQPLGEMKLVLLVKNKEHNIEGIIRSYFSGNVTNKTFENSRLSVIDMSSDDETSEILKRLSQYYDKMEFVRWEDRNNVFEDFGQEK